MATTALQPVFGSFHRKTSGRKLHPNHVRIALLVAAACAATVFSIAAPLGGNPALRLLNLDYRPTIPTEFDMRSERTTELSNQWVAVDTIDVDWTPIMSLPELDVHAGTPVTDSSASTQ
jgi:hypothetical protein